MDPNAEVSGFSLLKCKVVRSFSLFVSNDPTYDKPMFPGIPELERFRKMRVRKPVAVQVIKKANQISIAFVDAA
jgi:hypothetical protein